RQQQSLPSSHTNHQPQFCTPNVVNLTIVRKGWSDDLVTDANGNLLFKVKGPLLLKPNVVLLDNAGNPVVTLKEKALSWHGRWEVFRGESTDSKDLLFIVKNSSVMQSKTKLDVFLANNTSTEVCDFKLKANWSESPLKLQFYFQTTDARESLFSEDGQEDGDGSTKCRPCLHYCTSCDPI
ncbi:unnamed protein product, partial [Thlaspi arvense]